MTVTDPFLNQIHLGSFNPVTYQMIIVLAERTDTPPWILLAILMTESNLNPGTVDVGPTINHPAFSVSSQAGRADALNDMVMASGDITDVFTKTAFGIGQVTGAAAPLVGMSMTTFISHIYAGTKGQLWVFEGFIKNHARLKVALKFEDFPRIASHYAGMRWRDHYPDYADKIAKRSKEYKTQLKNLGYNV